MSVRDKIKAADDRQVTPIDPIPEWGIAEGEMVAVSPSADERARLMSGFIGADGKPSATPDLAAVYPALLIACLYDVGPDGAPTEPAFTAEDEGMLRSKNGAVVERLALACMKASGLDSSASEAGKGDSESADDDPTTS